MVILDTRPGQLANCLFLFGAFIANAIEHGYRLYIPAFAEYSHHFPAIAAGDLLGHRIRVRLAQSQRLDRLLGNLLAEAGRVLRRVDRRGRFHEQLDVSGWDAQESVYELNRPEFVRRARGKLLRARGWAFRDDENFRRHAPALRRLFSPHPAVLAAAKGHVHACRADRDLVVGVHARRGDYRSFRAGAYFFDEAVYADKMRPLRDAHADAGCSVSFVVCSDERLDLARFPDLDVHPGPGSVIEDLLALACCDAILAVPSTFSMWASYYGETPLRIFSRPDEEVSPGEFERLVALDLFESGSRFRHLGSAAEAAAPAAGLVEHG